MAPGAEIYVWTLSKRVAAAEQSACEDAPVDRPPPHY